MTFAEQTLREKNSTKQINIYLKLMLRSKALNCKMYCVCLVRLSGGRGWPTEVTSVRSFPISDRVNVSQLQDRCAAGQG